MTGLRRIHLQVHLERICDAVERNEHQEALMCCAGNEALLQVAQRGCGVSLEISFVAAWMGTLLWVFLLEHGLDQMDPEVSVNLSHIVTLRFCVIALLIYSPIYECHHLRNMQTSQNLSERPSPLMPGWKSALRNTTRWYGCRFYVSPLQTLSFR